MKLEITNKWTYASGGPRELKWLESALTSLSTGLFRWGKQIVSQTTSSSAVSRNHFATGLLSTVKSKSEEDELDLEIEDCRIMPGMPGPLPSHLGGIELRLYQLEAAEALLTAYRGIVKLPPRSGKTEVGIAALSAIGLNNSAILLVHSDELLTQWIKRLDSRGVPREDIGVISSKLWMPKALTVAMVQTLKARLDQRPCQDFLAQVTTVIGDEMHLAGNPTQQAVYRKLENAFWRFGFSATPFDYAVERNWKAMGVLGPVVYEAKDEELSEAGVLSDVVYHFLRVPKLLQGDLRGEGFRVCYTRYLFQNPIVRNMIALICDFVNPQKVLIIVNEVEHGKYISEGIPEAVFVHGERSMSERKKLLQRFQTGNTRILISSPILDFGIDFKRLPHLILAGGLESPIRLIQRIGRTRASQVSHIWDFDFYNHPYLEEHSCSRFESIKQRIPNARISRTL